MASSGFQTWEFVASVVGLIISVPIVYSWILDMMPTAKMRALDAVLSETETLLRSALEEGTIDYAYYDDQLRERIWSYVLLSSPSTRSRTLTPSDRAVRSCLRTNIAR